MDAVLYSAATLTRIRLARLGWRNVIQRERLKTLSDQQTVFAQSESLGAIYSAPTIRKNASRDVLRLIVGMVNSHAHYVDDRREVKHVSFTSLEVFRGNRSVRTDHVSEQGAGTQSSGALQSARHAWAPDSKRDKRRRLMINCCNCCRQVTNWRW